MTAIRPGFQWYPCVTPGLGCAQTRGPGPRKIMGVAQQVVRVFGLGLIQLVRLIDSSEERDGP